MVLFFGGGDYIYDEVLKLILCYDFAGMTILRVPFLIHWDLRGVLATQSLLCATCVR
jgi:hypothetical protein